VGAIEIQVNGEVVPTDELSDASAAAQEAMESQERHHRFQQSRIAMMRGYAEVHDCRREYLLNYFGEPFDDPCYHCDNCDAGRTITEDGSNLPFPLNSRVTHESWGGGMVMRYEGDKLTVLFDDVGYKTLALDIVIQSGLLQPEDETVAKREDLS
jgi:ATP-dependent DNA helicase RecQ